jgi:hypothetical protein
VVGRFPTTGIGITVTEAPLPEAPLLPRPQTTTQPKTKIKGWKRVRVIGGSREERRPKEGGAPFLPPSDPGPAPDPQAGQAFYALSPL